MKRALFNPLTRAENGSSQASRLRIPRRLLLISILMIVACGGEEPAPGRTYGPIIIISVDTLRADHLPVYGASVVETPNLDGLAADAIVFENAYSQVPLTLPSHASMLTGRLPAETGVRNNLGYRLDDAIPSLPVLLKKKGFTTGAAVSAYVLRSETGVGDIFDHYDDTMEPSSPGAIVGEIQRRGDDTVSAAIDWLEEQSGERIFLFVHLFEPHAPYDPPEAFSKRYADHPYDGEIAAADAAVGRLLEYLKKAGLYDDAMIVFMSDHGEGLGDHGESEHGIFLYREAIHVPLFLKLPRSERGGTRHETPVGLVDIFPTIADAAGAYYDPSEIAGRSLLGWDEGAPARRIYSETMYPRIHLGWSDLASLVDESHHYIQAPHPELYDVTSDPGETKNVLSEERRIYASMRDELDGYDRELAAPEAISAEEAAKLSALGYLGGTGGSGENGSLPDPKDRIGDLEAYADAATLVRSGQGSEAIGSLEGIVNRNPTFADAWTMLAKAYDQAGRLDDAVGAYRRTIEVAPMLAPGTALSLSELFLKLGEFEEALDHAALAREAHPSNSALVRARALIGMGRPDDAIQALEPALTDPAVRSEALVARAQAMMVQRQFERALAILDELKATGQPVPGRSFTEGDILARMGRVEEAKQSFRREIAQFPRNREAFIRLAAIHVLEGKPAEAERVMRSLVAANPGPATRAMIAEAYRGLGRPDLAANW